MVVGGYAVAVIGVVVVIVGASAADAVTQAAAVTGVVVVIIGSWSLPEP